MTHVDWKPYPKVEPKDKDSVKLLVTRRYNNGDEDEYLVETAYWCARWKLIFPVREENPVVAWDYCPEPYQPEAKDE